MADIPFPAGVSGSCWSSIEALHSEPPRSYHHIGHVREVLAHWDAVNNEDRWTDALTTWVAVVLHDAVYVPGRSDNESRSADLVPEWCAQHGVRADVSRAQALIRATASHGRLQPGDVDGEMALFLDCDMAILGSPPERFDRYDAEVREEYAGLVPIEQVEAGRRAFLQEVLDAERIFLSGRFHAALDEAARSNLRRHLLK